jgi:uncharacterized iron-regulated protein
VKSKGITSLAIAMALSGCANAPPVDTFGDLTSYALVRADNATQSLTVTQAADVLASYDVIFLGELHRHPGNHLAEMALFRAIHERAPSLSLSMEQFERDVQPAVDDYLAGRTGETPFMSASRAWNNYATSYRPLVEYAKAHKLPLIAANAPEKVVRCVGREGADFLKRMTPEQRGWAAADLHLNEGPYRDKFLGFVGSDAGHGGDGSKDKAAQRPPPSESALRSFAAQVTRDDTMAESIALHLQKNPGRKVVHINGAFHSASFLGTVERLQARMPQLKIAVVNPIQVGGDSKVDQGDLKTGTLLLLIGRLPEDYATDAEMNAAIKKQIAARAASKCEL